MWVYLNWCLGLKEFGCRVVWLDKLPSRTGGRRCRSAYQSSLSHRGRGVTPRYSGLSWRISPIIRESRRLVMRAHDINRGNGGGCCGTLATRWRLKLRARAALAASTHGARAAIEGERSQGLNVRIGFIVTNLPGRAKVLYEKVYCARGRMENLIKDMKLHTRSDRLASTRATTLRGLLQLAAA
jgi:Transposase DDE domain group 1